MPNWVQQKVIIKGDADKVDYLYEHLRRHSSFCQVVLPMPFEYATSSDDAWRDWAILNWGTKWDVADIANLNKDDLADESKRRLSFRCNTANTAPQPVWDHLVRLGLRVSAAYADTAMDLYGFYEDGDDRRDDGAATMVSYMLDIDVDERD